MPTRTRQEPRYPVALVVTLFAAGVSTDCVTHDVSFEGVFVETAPIVDTAEEPLPRTRKKKPAALTLGQLVRLKISLPASPEPLDVPAVVVHTLHRGKKNGAGLRFYAMGREARAAWDRFISRLRDEFPKMDGRAVGLPRAEHFEPKLYRSAHQVAVVRVYVPSVAELYALAEPGRDTMFVVADERVRVGDEIGLQLVHPDSEEIFELSAFVTRIVSEQGVRGLDLEFLDLDTERRARLKEFIDDGLEALFDEEIFVDDTHPGIDASEEPAERDRT